MAAQIREVMPRHFGTPGLPRTDPWGRGNREWALTPPRPWATDDILHHGGEQITDNRSRG